MRKKAPDVLVLPLFYILRFDPRFALFCQVKGHQAKWLKCGVVEIDGFLVKKKFEFFR